MKKQMLLCFAILCATAISALAVDVKENWEKQCAKCHGPDGKGDTKMGKKAGVKDYTDPKVLAELKDDVAFKRVKEGLKEGDKTKMKSYAEVLSDDEIKALVTFIRAFGKN